MAGLRRICKMYGSMIVQGKRWVWDYKRDIPVLETEMTPEQWKESEQAKWMSLKDEIKRKDADLHG